MHSLLHSAGWLLLFMTCVRASVYYIDDTSSVIQYSPVSSWSSGFDTKCFNDTRTFSFCTQDDICGLKIPFTGSGITIYATIGVHIGANVSVTVDGSTPTIHTMPNRQESQYNVSIYDIQSLPVTAHTIDITVMHWAGDVQDEPATFAFDFATVSGAPTPPTPPAPPTKSHPPVGAVVGGVLGALGAITANIIAFLCHRRRKQRRKADPEHNAMTLIGASHPSPPPYSPPLIKSPPNKTNADSTSSPPSRLLVALDLASNNAPSTTSMMTPARGPQSVVNIPATNGDSMALYTHDTDALGAHNDIPPPPFFAPMPSPSNRHTVPNGQSTTEHFDFMTALYSMNVRAGNV